MDLKAYFSDLRAKESELEVRAKDGVVYVTSVFHREKNSTPGSTLSATPRNAARVITDGTHRESSVDEVQTFLDHQRRQLEQTTLAEQGKKKQYIVVVDQNQPAQSAFLPSKPVMEAAKPLNSSGKPAND